jgi:carboxymethylenebutenolidase
MGDTVEFASNGSSASGYLALPASGSGPGLLVIQEWWGLVPQIKRTCDRFAGEGFVALAPDLYHGEVAEHDEMDKAGHLMQTLPMDRAGRDMKGAIDYLLGRSEVTGDAVGVVGYCMGGMLTLLIAAQEGSRVAAAAPHYGAPLGDNAPDWSNLQAAVRGHFAEKDDFFPPDAVKALEAELRGMGKEVSIEVHAGTGHAFCNEENALGTYDEQAAERVWTDVVQFLHSKLG